MRKARLWSYYVTNYRLPYKRKKNNRGACRVPIITPNLFIHLHMKSAVGMDLTLDSN